MSLSARQYTTALFCVVHINMISLRFALYILVCTFPSVSFAGTAEKRLLLSVVYNEWSLWNWCSAPCGITGVRYRTRGCHSTLFGLVNFNAKCDTGGEETENCVGACPHTTTAATLYPGTWSSWGQFSLCDKTCGGGIQIRHRTCVSGPCIGDSLESASCNDHPCAATMTQLTTTKATTNTKAMTRWATITSTIKATAAWKEFIMSRSIKNVT
ncbi:semaphorin-5B-like isoform X2 [Crassostrea angulata]|uniref:semaphorin-5B-like isoform X2 n=1 Tax=Magallana angulata TaxID=2784310 RepID=UPI0022B1A87C|nr:semaphorin-5B-like isoform X2 [Crassostrea angulata]